MNHRQRIISYHICEQIRLVESLAAVLQQQLNVIDPTLFADARQLVEKARAVLITHYDTLNPLLDVYMAEENKEERGGDIGGANGTVEPDAHPHVISSLLRDDYSALNQITMGITMMYTTALSLKDPTLASIALLHLENLAPLVIELGMIVPHVVARELHRSSHDIDMEVAATAVTSTRKVWSKAG